MPPVIKTLGLKMKKKLSILLLAIIILFPNICVSEEFILPLDDAINIETQLSASTQSCILIGNSYSNMIYTDIYQCAETKNLEKSLLQFSNYPYFTFTFSWYFQGGTTIKDASNQKTLLAAAMKHKSNTETIVENLIIDEGSNHLWHALEKYTCFRLNSNMSIGKRHCSK
ncbi:hypothetical protein SAMN05660420_03368 [Desulfuromusa kysingii]|uniref:Uncharacterized protein n=1 Tax=Desulfuromusa kysingii TaxID=37625 RepID=A0A1H4EFX4_9BACT|nr:hypothetical protein [Desulfuromusa kysingii]SEA83913.1 hypothetical protein SAMN05660420_03368 [Desulfuromusa kysingii]